LNEVTGLAEGAVAIFGSRAAIIIITCVHENLQDEGIILCNPVAITVTSSILADFVVRAAAPARTLGVEEAPLVGGQLVGFCELAPAGYLGT
jgi:3-dehydroquinate dehydratase